MTDIIREYPNSGYVSLYNYPTKVREETFDKWLESTTKEFHDNYVKWTQGINHRTNRKVKIGGRQHNVLKHDFMIPTDLTHSSTSWIIFNKFDNSVLQDFNSYGNYLFDYTLKYKEIESLNEPIKCINRERSIVLQEVINKIENLKGWDDYIEFEGKKYGIPNVFNKIHRFNDCFGEVKGIYYGCGCGSCENRYKCSNPQGYKYYCTKCSTIGVVVL